MHLPHFNPFVSQINFRKIFFSNFVNFFLIITSLKEINNIDMNEKFTAILEITGVAIWQR